MPGRASADQRSDPFANTTVAAAPATIAEGGGSASLAPVHPHLKGSQVVAASPLVAEDRGGSSDVFPDEPLAKLLSHRITCNLWRYWMMM